VSLIHIEGCKNGHWERQSRVWWAEEMMQWLIYYREKARARNRMSRDTQTEMRFIKVQGDKKRPAWRDLHKAEWRQHPSSGQRKP
jgi:hypothetical protein